jgi:hypothetical protein
MPKPHSHTKLLAKLDISELGVQRLMLSEISKKRLKYLGHANRNTKTDLMTTVLQVKVEAKRNQGRPLPLFCCLDSVFIILS